MIYAYRETNGEIALYASEANTPAPAGFVPCELDLFLVMWRRRDVRQLQQLHAALHDPYEAELCRAEA